MKKRTLGYTILAAMALALTAAIAIPLGYNSATGSWELLQAVEWVAGIYGFAALMVWLTNVACRLISSEE